MKTFLFSILLLMSSLAFGQFSNQQKQYLAMDNLLSNPGLENGKAGWTCAAGTFTADSAAKIDGGLSGKVVLSGQTLDCSISVNTNAALQSSVGVILQALKTSLADVQVCSIVDGTTSSTCNSYDGSNIVKEVSPVYFNFGATSVGIRIKTAGTVSGTVYFDGSKIGRVSSAMMPNISQPQIAGSSYFAGSTNCLWARSSSSMSSFTNDSDCPGPTVTLSNIGTWLTTDSDLPIQTINNLPPGTYRATFRHWVNSSGGSSTYLSVHDGTSACEPTVATNTSANSTQVTVSCEFTYTSTGNRSFQLIGAAASGSIQVYNSETTTRASLKFHLDYTPPASTVMANYYPWKVDVNIGGADPALGTTAVSSYTEVTNGSLDLVVNPNSAAVQIPCSSTNASSGLTCSAGSESVGLYIPSLPFPGEFKVCAQFTGAVRPSASSSMFLTFQLVETTNSTQTIIQEGKTRNSIGGNLGSASAYIDAPVNTCGNFVFTDTNPKTIRLMYELAVGGTNAGAHVLAGRDAGNGQRDIHFTVEPVTPFMIASLLNYVSSPGMKKPKIFEAKIDSSDVVSREGGYNWINGNCTDTSTTGAVTCNFVSGNFSDEPYCWMQIGPGATQSQLLSISSSAISYSTYNAGGSLTNATSTLFCIGE